MRIRSIHIAAGVMVGLLLTGAAGAADQSPNQAPYGHGDDAKLPSGERYFMQHLIDRDVSANNGNWQWCASTGADAMRGYRIFNPALQSKMFDPEGRYIRRFVPELTEVPPAFIHEPHKMTRDDQARVTCRIGLDYPASIVDHQQARQEYLTKGMAVKGRA